MLCYEGKSVVSASTSNLCLTARIQPRVRTFWFWLDRSLHSYWLYLIEKPPFVIICLEAFIVCGCESITDVSLQREFFYQVLSEVLPSLLTPSFCIYLFENAY